MVIEMPYNKLDEIKSLKMELAHEAYLDGWVMGIIRNRLKSLLYEQDI